MRVYDCFTFFNELDLLEIRLNELSPYVDKFVLSESTLTHQGKPKPLYFMENKDRFSAFKDKLIPIVVDRFPENKNGDSWVYERHQREMLKEGLKECQAEDVVIISDVDEIPRPDRINEYKSTKGIKVFEQNMYYYFVNCVNTTAAAGEYRWYGSAMAKFRDYRSPQYLRYLSIMVLNHKNAGFIGKAVNILSRYNQPEMWRSDIKVIRDGGWHFSYLGGVDKIISKIEAFAHREYNKDEFKNPDLIRKKINEGQDIFGRNFSYGFVQLDSTFPAYLTGHPEKFGALIFNQ